MPVCVCVCLCVCVWCGTIRPRLLIRLFWFLFILHSFARGRHVVGARRSNSFAEKPKTSVNVESARHSLCLCTYCKHNQSVFHCFGRRAMIRGEVNTCLEPRWPLTVAHIHFNAHILVYSEESYEICCALCTSQLIFFTSVEAYRERLLYSVFFY